MTTPARHYLFAMWEGAGLVPAELTVARHLIERGHRVTVLADPPIARDAHAIGAAFRAWDLAPVRASREPEDDLVSDWEVNSPFELMRRMRERFVIDPAAAFAADVTVCLEQLRPDVVVSDVLLVGAHVAAEAAAIPRVALVPNIYLFPAPGTPPFGTGWSEPTSSFARMRSSLVDRLTTRLWDKGLPTLNELRGSYGLGPLETVWAQLDRLDRVLVLTSASFDIPGRLPDNVRYSGPQLDDPSWADGSFAPPPGDEPLVLVSLSSGYQDQLDTLQRIVAALASLPVRAVVTTGLAIDPDRIAAPPEVRVVRSAPHSEVLAHADAVVTHGGHATLLKALRAGLPAVCLPMGRDQADNAARLVRLGAGVRLRRGARPAAIAGAVGRILDEPGFGVAAGRVADRLAQEATDPPRVVQELGTLARDDQATGIATG